MSAPKISRLLELLAEGTELARAADEAGYDSSDEASEELKALSVKQARSRRRKADADEALPGPPPKKSPYTADVLAVVNADGGSRGNPGPAAYGCVYAVEDGTVLCAEGVGIGKATNNVAEYRGAIAALTRLADWGVRRALLRLDSQLVVRQLEGSYRVKDAGLKPLHAEASGLMRHFDDLRLEFVPRKQNAMADRFANLALDGKL